MPLKGFYWDALCLSVAQIQRYEGDCPKTLQQMFLTESTLCAFLLERKVDHNLSCLPFYGKAVAK